MKASRDRKNRSVPNVAATLVSVAHDLVRDCRVGLSGGIGGAPRQLGSGPDAQGTVHSDSMEWFSSATRNLRWWAGVLGRAGSNWLESQAFIYAAALAFFTVFSIAPVMIVAVAVVGLVLGTSAAEGELLGQLREVIGPEAAGVVETAVLNSQLDQSGWWPTLAGLAAIVLGATTVFAQMQQSLNTIWNVAPRPHRGGLWRLLKARLLSLTIVLVIGFVLLVSLLLSVILRALIVFAEQWLPIAGWALVGLEITVSLTVVTLLFAAIFKVLPDVVLSLRDVLLGGLVTALLFTLGRSLIALYLANTATASTWGRPARWSCCCCGSTIHR